MRDRRNSAILPEPGTLQRLFGEIALPGFDLKYYKVSYDATWFYPLTRDMTTMLRGLIGWGGGYAGIAAPVFQGVLCRRYGLGALATSRAPSARRTERRARREPDVLGSAEVLVPFPGPARTNRCASGGSSTPVRCGLDQDGLGTRRQDHVRRTRPARSDRRPFLAVFYGRDLRLEFAVRAVAGLSIRSRSTTSPATGCRNSSSSLGSSSSAGGDREKSGEDVEDRATDRGAAATPRTRRTVPRPSPKARSGS